MGTAPAVLLANHYQFAPGQHLAHGPVMSCMQAWCRAGRGDIDVDGVTYAMTPGRAVLMPWRHRVAYRADRRVPFLISGIHVIPAMRDGLALHNVDHDGQELPGREAGQHPLGSRSHSIALPEHRHLAHLSEYVVASFTRKPRESDQRQLARMLIDEWASALSTTAANEPGPLARARRFVLDHLDRRPDREAMARAANVSPATLQRLCARHLALSPVAWAQRLRIEAATPLVTGSRLPLAELAARFGFCDAFHFSRAFKRHLGVAPEPWRRRHALL